MIAFPLPPRWIRVLAIIGIFVCGGWTLLDLRAGAYKEAALYAFFTAANVLAYRQNRRDR